MAVMGNQPMKNRFTGMGQKKIYSQDVSQCNTARNQSTTAAVRKPLLCYVKVQYVKPIPGVHHHDIDGIMLKSENK